jgi:hypothetical protein
MNTIIFPLKPGMQGENVKLLHEKLAKLDWNATNPITIYTRFQGGWISQAQKVRRSVTYA